VVARARHLSLVPRRIRTPAFPLTTYQRQSRRARAAGPRAILGGMPDYGVAERAPSDVRKEACALFGRRKAQRVEGLNGLPREVIGDGGSCGGHEVPRRRAWTGNDILRDFRQRRAHDRIRDLDLCHRQSVRRDESRCVEESCNIVRRRALMRRPGRRRRSSARVTRAARIRRGKKHGDLPSGRHWMIEPHHLGLGLCRHCRDGRSRACGKRGIRSLGRRKAGRHDRHGNCQSIIGSNCHGSRKTEALRAGRGQRVIEGHELARVRLVCIRRGCARR